MFKITQEQSPIQNVGTLQFHDIGTTWTSGMDVNTDSTMMTGQTSDTNERWFRSPIKIATYSWTPNLGLSFNLDPFSLFFRHPTVANRLAHFKNLRCSLRLKLLINGTKFYYGKVIVGAVPLPYLDNLTAFRPNVRADYIEFTQRPYVMLDPSTSEGATLNLPYVYMKNYVDIPTGEYDQLYAIQISDFNTLQTSSDVVEPLTISVFAEPYDISYSVPTTVVDAQIQPQSDEQDMPNKVKSDEYTKPSAIAHTIANWSGKLVKAPVIGPYARATQVISSSIGNIAQLFGYSRPTDIERTQVVNKFMSPMSVTNSKDACYTLALDQKKEITIDPTVTGGSKEDEMALLPILMKECFLNTFVWNINNGPETLLWNTRVSPMNGDVENGEIHMTPQAWASNAFQYWTGSIEYRFQVVASQFHRGRLRVVWDPIYYDQTKTDDYNLAYSQIVDIANGQTFTVRVGWGAQTAYLKNNDVSAIPVHSTSPITTVDNCCNGTLSVYVLNELAIPNLNTGETIDVNVYMRGCEDMELASPRELLGYEDVKIFDPPSIIPSELRDTYVYDAGAAGVVSNFGSDSVKYTTTTDTYRYRISAIVTVPFYGNPDDPGPYNIRLGLRNQGGTPHDITVSIGGTDVTLSLSAGQLENFDVPINPLPGFNLYAASLTTLDASSDVIEIETVRTRLPVGVNVGFKNVNDLVMENPNAFINSNGYAEDPGGWDFSPPSLSAGYPITFIHADSIAVGGSTYDTGPAPNAQNLGVASDGNVSGLSISINAVPLATPAVILHGAYFMDDIGPQCGKEEHLPPYQLINNHTCTKNCIKCQQRQDIGSYFRRVYPEVDLPQGEYECSHAETLGLPIDPFEYAQMLEDIVESSITIPLAEVTIYPEADEHPNQAMSGNTPDCCEQPPPVYMGETVNRPNNQVYFGEQVNSLRMLLKRYVYWCEFFFTQNTRWTMPTNPTTPFDYSTDPNVTTFKIGSNPTRWFTSAYVAIRGSWRVKINNCISASTNGQIAVINRIVGDDLVTERTETAAFVYENQYEGTEVVLSNVNPTGEFELPWYSPYRFYPGRYTGRNDYENGIVQDWFRFHSRGGSSGPDRRVSFYTSIGEDFSSSVFLCTPILTVSQI